MKTVGKNIDAQIEFAGAVYKHPSAKPQPHIKLSKLMRMLVGFLFYEVVPNTSGSRM
jgi:hypothetical protein